MFDALPDDNLDREAPPGSGARERMGLLRRMSEIGVRMAERLDRRSELAAVYAEADAAPEGLKREAMQRLETVARAFARVSRAVSISVALEERIERGQTLPIPLSPPAAREASPVDARSRLGARRDAAGRALVAAIDEEVGVRDPVRAAALHLDLDRLLDRELAAVDALLERPVEAVIARIRRELGLKNDPSPGRGRVMSDGPRRGPYAIANDLAIAAKNAEAQAEAGPVAQQREDGVTDAGRLAPAAAILAKPASPAAAGGPPRSGRTPHPPVRGPRTGPILPLPGEGFSSA